MNVDLTLQQLIDAQAAYRAALDTVQAEAAALFVAIRDERNLTQRQLAAALNVNHTFISKVENGRMRPGRPVLARLAAYLESMK